MISARAGGLLLGVAGAAVPDTFSERHAGSFLRGVAIAAWAAASHVPACRDKRVATLAIGARRGRELHCRYFP